MGPLARSQHATRRDTEFSTHVQHISDIRTHLSIRMYTAASVLRAYVTVQLVSVDEPAVYGALYPYYTLQVLRHCCLDTKRKHGILALPGPVSLGLCGSKCLRCETASPSAVLIEH